MARILLPRRVGRQCKIARVGPGRPAPGEGGKIGSMAKKICDNILETIGHTPMVRLNRLTKGVVAAEVVAKIETFNPGNSIKDRMALKMIEDAERDGRLKPGGTIIEGTSGNTGMGLAIAAVVKGYHCIFTTTDKQSKEKVGRARAFGADVIVCPTDVEPEDPRSYYSVSSRLERDTPNSLEGQPVRQPVERPGPLRADRARDLGPDRRPRRSPGGRRRHRRHHLRRREVPSRNGSRRSRPGGSTPTDRFQEHKETGVFDKNEIYPYITEGIGEDFLPQNVDFSVIDHFEKVTDRDAAIMTSRIAREEGIFAGNSAGSAMAGLLQLAAQLQGRRAGGRHLPRPRHPLPRQDVQPGVDAREGLPRQKGLTAKDPVADRQKAGW